MTRDLSDWCYPCGTVAVLEIHLLGAHAPGEPVGAPASPEELLARLRHSPVYAALHLPRHSRPMGVIDAVERALVAFVRGFVRLCPDPRVADAFLIDYDLRDLSNYLKATCCGTERRRVELSRLPEDDEEIEAFVEGEPPLRAIAAALDHARRAGDGSVTPHTVDLVVDGAYIAMIPELVAPLGSELLDAWARERQRFFAAGTVVRARLAGVEPAEIHDTLLWRMPPHCAAAELADVELGALRRTLADRLSPEAAADFDPAEGAPAMQRLVLALDAVLARVLAPARYVAFGPERVFRFLWQLFGENRNVRAALAGFGGQLEPELVALSMRGTNG